MVVVWWIYYIAITVSLPEIYKTGIATAGVPSHFVYNNIYQERYLGVLPENRDIYIKCSPITYAKNLQGHLLIIHVQATTMYTTRGRNVTE